MPYPHASLATLLDAMKDQELPPLTEEGTAILRQQIAIGVPFVPGVLVMGTWYDWCEGPVDAGIQAIIASQEPSDDPAHQQTHELQATYVMGLLVGFTLSSALSAVPESGLASGGRTVPLEGAGVQARPARPPALARFFDTLQVAADLEREYERDDNGPVGDFRRAIPVAKAILVHGNVLQGGPEVLEDYVRRECDRVRAQPDNPTDPNHECAVAAANEDAVYYVALAIGLLLSEVL